MHHVLPAFETMIVGGRAQDEELPMPQGMARQA
jgi:hypothetical protein